MQPSASCWLRAESSHSRYYPTYYSAAFVMRPDFNELSELEVNRTRSSVIVIFTCICFLTFWEIVIGANHSMTLLIFEQ